MVLLLTLRADEVTDTTSDDAPPVSAVGTTACSTSSTSIADAWDASLIAAFPIHSACACLASRRCLSQVSYPNFASAVAIIE